MVLCSDCLFNELSGDEIVPWKDPDPAAIVDILIERANAQGGGDNISLVVVEVAA